MQCMSTRQGVSAVASTVMRCKLQDCETIANDNTMAPMSAQLHAAWSATLCQHGAACVQAQISAAVELHSYRVRASDSLELPYSLL